MMSGNRDNHSENKGRLVSFPRNMLKRCFREEGGFSPTKRKEEQIFSYSDSVSMRVLGRVIHIHKIAYEKKNSKDTDKSISFSRSARIKAVPKGCC